MLERPGRFTVIHSTNTVKCFEGAIYLKPLDSLSALVRIKSLENCEGFLVENMKFKEVLTVPYSRATGLTNLYVFTPPVFCWFFTFISYKCQ
jgi:hypothetical protein